MLARRIDSSVTSQCSNLYKEGTELRTELSTVVEATGSPDSGFAVLSDVSRSVEACVLRTV